MKKIYLFKAIALVAILTCALSASAATTTFTKNGITYQLTTYSDDSGVLSVQNKGYFNSYSGVVNIPDSVEYLESNAFALCDKLLNVHMGSGLKHIGSQVFNSCDSLQIITFSTDGTWDIYDTNNNKVGTISGEKLSDKPYYYFIWQTPDYIHIKQTN